jgi:hypothetical protein
MKAETVLYNHLTQVFTSESNDRKMIIKAMQEYARIQIEKDRGKVKKSLRGLYDLVIDETPINLD